MDDDEIEQHWREREREAYGDPDDDELATRNADGCTHEGRRGECGRSPTCRDCGQCKHHCECEPCCG